LVEPGTLKDDIMKRILLGERREKLIDTAELILKHWGYRVLASSNPEQLARFLRDVHFDLLILGNNLFHGEKGGLADLTAALPRGHHPPLLLLSDGEPATNGIRALETLPVPLDIFRLFTLIQRHLESTPRRNLRLKLQLPGIFNNGSAKQRFAEVLSLSVHGLFIKTGCRVDNLERLNIIIPLFGMKTEVEISGRVLYRVKPGPENNYLQGVGIEFTDLTPETVKIIQDFLESRVLGELAESIEGSRQFDLSQLQVHSHRDLTLRSVDPPAK
jgi:CheY-like chemotaxis protein